MSDLGLDFAIVTQSTVLLKTCETSTPVVLKLLCKASKLKR